MDMDEAVIGNMIAARNRQREQDQRENRFRELCTQLRQNDSSITRVEAVLYIIGGHGRRLGQALLQNTVVTSIRLVVHHIVSINASTTESAAPLLQYLQTSTALKEVRVNSNTLGGVLGQLQREIIQAIALSPSIESVDFCLAHQISPEMMTLLLTTTTSVTKLKFRDDEFLSDMSMLRQVATAFGANHTIEDLTITLCSRRSVDQTTEWALEDEPILLQLGTHSKLRRLCLAMDSFQRRLTAIHIEAIATLLLSTQTLQCLELLYYKFKHHTLSPILDAFKENATVTNLRLQYCTMNEEATQDFINFVQTQCNVEGNKLRSLVLIASPNQQMYKGINIGSVAATMLIGSSLQSLHLSDHVENGRVLRDNAFDMALFFSTLLEHKDQVRLASLIVERLNRVGANAMLEYLPQAVHLRNLTVLRMHHGVDSAHVMAALRRNGSLYSVVMTKQVAASGGEPLQPFFSANEHGRIQAFVMLNQCVPIMLSVRRSSNDVTTNVASHLHLYTHLFAAIQPTVGTAPNSLTAGLLSGNQAFVTGSSDTRKRRRES